MGALHSSHVALRGRCGVAGPGALGMWGM